MQMRRNLPMLKREDNLDQPCDTGSRFQMAHIRFHGSGQQRPRLWPTGAIHGTESLQLNWIAQRCSRSVRFDVADGGGRKTGIEKSLSHERFLRRPIGRSQTATCAILIDRRATNDGQDAVSVRFGLREPLQRDKAAALAAHKAVRALIEGPAGTFRREHAQAREHRGCLRRKHDIHAAGQGKMAVPAAEALAGYVDCNQRRGACRIERNARPLQTEHVRDSPGSDAMRYSRRIVDIHRVRIARRL